MSNIVPPKDLPEPNLDVVARQERTQSYVNFLKFVAQSTGHVSYEQLTILYPAICQAALEWLVKEHKSIDFGFCILHPCPYRTNWKQIMLASFPKLGPSLAGKSRRIRDALMTESGFFTKLLSGELLAVARERYALWGIMVEPKRSWWKAVHRYEQFKFGHLGSIEYAAHLARKIVALRPRVLNVYLSFLNQMRLPCARIKQSNIYRRGFIVPFVPKGGVRPVRETETSETPYTCPRFPEELAPPKPPPMALPLAVLPEMSNLSPETSDLRLGGTTLDTRGAIGVSMLDAEKSTP